ncbi:MAG: S8 family peptidase, partial [Euryarchaeota archaeon]|nr:S8 family peptidase [Euryarchaeota archaeon]
MPIPSEKALIHSERGFVKHEYRLIPAVSASLSEQAINDMRKNPRVAYIEDDVILTIATDEYVNSPGVSRIGCEMAHNNGIDGTGVKVAVIDTGMDYTHEDMDANYKGGYDFVSDDPDPFEDYNSHGTHVAGIIAAERNGVGVVGVAPNVSLYAVRVLDSAGFGTASWVIAGIEWAVDNDMDVVVMSLGTSKDSQSLRDACCNASGAGVLLVAAAGNTHGGDVTYPARYDSVIAVTATDPDDDRASLSPIGQEIELAAPGVDIRSTVVGGSSYGNLSGTSQAAPHVAGTAALIISSNLSDVNDDGVVNNEDVRLQLQSMAQDLGDPGKDDTYGYGLVDARITAAAISCNCGDICVNETGWWRDGGVFNASGTPIQAAVDDATAGETICVMGGSYSENVDVTTDHLTIRSETGSVSTIVQAVNPGDHVFEVVTDYVNISGFSVAGATGTSRAG